MGCCEGWCVKKQSNDDKNCEIDLDVKKSKEQTEYPVTNKENQPEQTGYLVTDEEKEDLKEFLGHNRITNKDVIPEIKVKLHKNISIFISIKYAEEVKKVMIYVENKKNDINEAFKETFKLVSKYENDLTKNENPLERKVQIIIVKTDDLDEELRNMTYDLGWTPSQILEELKKALNSKEVKNFIEEKKITKATTNKTATTITTITTITYTTTKTSETTMKTPKT